MLIQLLTMFRLFVEFNTVSLNLSKESFLFFPVFLAFFFLYIFILGPCPDSWISGVHGSCYKFSSNTLRWKSAKSVCEALGSKLAVLNSQDEQQFLTPKVAKNTWIGLHRDPKNTARWLWVDGSYATYTNWNDGEPNDVGGREDCVALLKPPYTGKWNDQNCNASVHYVCEISRK